MKGIDPIIITFIIPSKQSAFHLFWSCGFKAQEEVDDNIIGECPLPLLMAFLGSAVKSVCGFELEDI